MDTARNAPPGRPPDPVPPPAPAGLPVPARRALGSVLLGGTMWLAGLLALWRALWETLT